jgi:hypothetical protein
LQIAAEKVGLPLDVVRLEESPVRELYAYPLVLVRPDGHVAWRGESAPQDANKIIDKVRGAV